MGVVMPNAGQIIRASDFARVVDFTTLTANTAGSASEATAATSATINFIAGRCYRVTMKGLVASTVNGDVATVRVRRDTTGGTVWLDSMGITCSSTAQNYPFFFETYMACTGSVSAVLLLRYVRSAGTGNISIQATSTASYAYLKTEDIGLASDYPNSFSFS